MAAALDRVGAEQILSLYLHIPFCRAICWYCGCNRAANQTARLDAYLARLHDEIDLVAAGWQGAGGSDGSPLGAGAPMRFRPRLCRAGRPSAHSLCQRGRTLSLEIDPRGFDADWAGVIADTGVARVSLGVQTFDPILQAVNGSGPARRGHHPRRHAAAPPGRIDQFRPDVRLPGQDDAALAATLDETIALARNGWRCSAMRMCRTSFRASAASMRRLSPARRRVSARRRWRMSG